MFLDRRIVRTIFYYYVALSGVLLSCGKRRVASASYCFECTLYGYGILSCVNYAFNSSDSVGVSLTYALAPESIGCAAGQNALCVNSVEREHTGVPTAADKRELAVFFSGFVYIGKMLRDVCVRIETVDYVEILCNSGSLYGQIRSRTAAEYEYVYIVFVFCDIVGFIYLYTLGERLNTLGISSRKYCRQSGIGIVCDCALYSLAEIAVT